MKKIIKKTIVFILLTVFWSANSIPCAAVSFKKSVEKKHSEKTVQKNDSEEKNSLVKVVKDKLRIPELYSSGTEKSKTVKAVKVKKTKWENTKIIAQDVENKTKSEISNSKRKKQPEKLKVKRQTKKEAESTVIAKTDKNQPSVVIQTNNDQSKKSLFNRKQNTKQQTTLEKAFSPEPKDESTVISEEPQTQIQDTEPLPDNVFNASASMEGSVSTNTIISVDDCVKIALENNPLIISQMMSKDIYKNKVAQAWSNYFPTLTAGIDYSRNDMLVANFKFPMQKYNLYHLPTVGANLLLYDFGKTGAQAAVAKKTYEASKENLQASINDIVYQVKSSYYNLLYLQQQVEVYEDSVLQYQIHLNQAQAYYDIGSKAKIDVTTAQYNLDNTKLTLITAKNSVDEGFARLTNSMGTPEIPPFSIKDRLDRKKYNVQFDDILQTAYESRPDLMAAKRRMEGSKLLIKSSKTAFLPNLQGFASYNQGGSHPDTDYGYQIGAQLAYSNVNLYLLKKQMDEAKLTYKKDQADYEVQRQKIYLDVKQAFIQLRNAQQSIPVARSNMNVAKERYDLAAGRYKAGLGDAIELKDAQNTYMTAKLQYYNSLMQYHISAANVERVIGAPLTATDESL